jgi:diacylglycerol O-acyltransferase
MQQGRDDNRLSGGDALFLYLEREGMPLNVASVNVFEGEVSLKACISFVESKLPLIPRYLQRVVSPPFNIGLPAWEFDPEFDIRNHIHEIALKRGTQAEFKAVAGKILSRTMDRQRPLWDFTVVRGLKGGNTGIITRMHHCLADGLAGVGLLNVLMDPSPEVHPLPKRKVRVQAPPQRDSTTSLLDELIASSSSVAQRVLTAQTELLSVLQHVLGTNGRDGSHTEPQVNGEADLSVDDLAQFMPELTGTTQRLPFNIICRGPQNFRWAEIPLADIKAIKQACGATVNDVVLTIVASAIQRYVERQKVRIEGRLLRIGVPVNVRGKGSVGDLGNRITFLPLTIPLDIRSPRKLMSAIQERVAFSKRAHVAELVGMAGTMLGTIPTAAQVVVGPIISQLPLGLCNLICTNVPGPAFPLYLLGHKLLHFYPYVPIGGDIGINCAVLTYNGTAYFGFTGDVHAAPDLWRLEKFLTASFVELRKSLRIPSPRRKIARAAKRADRRGTSAAKPGRRPLQSVILTSSKPDPEPTTATEEKSEPQARVVA